MDLVEWYAHNTFPFYYYNVSGILIAVDIGGISWWELWCTIVAVTPPLARYSSAGVNCCKIASHKRARQLLLN